MTPDLSDCIQTATKMGQPFLYAAHCSSSLFAILDTQVCPNQEGSDDNKPDSCDSDWLEDEEGSVEVVEDLRSGFIFEQRMCKLLFIYGNPNWELSM